MKKETLEEAVERLIPDNFIKVAPKKKVNAADISRHYFIAGAKWQAERMYSRQDLVDFVYFLNDRHFNRYTVDTDEVDLFIEQFKKK